MSISPQRRYVLLPQDREIMALTGIDEKEYREFCRACQDFSKIRPGSPVSLGFWATVAIQLAIGALFTGISYLLAPKPEQETATTVEQSTVEGQDIIRRDKFTPKSGFDSIQNVVEMGSIIPIIYAKRDNGYGGLRVNTNLLWSQLLSIGGGQFFKGLFLVGEGSPVLDLDQTALGNNTLSSFQLGNSTAGRLTIYYKPEGGRISQSDYARGVEPDNDIACKTGDVDCTDDIYTVLRQKDFCQAVLPSNQTEFGVYAPIGNNLGHKIGEGWNPLVQWQQRADTTFERQASNEKVATREKESYTFTTRAGFVAEGGDSEGLVTVNRGKQLKYKIFRTSEEAKFEEDGSSSGGEQPSTIKADDVANAIASKQRSFDERINEGGLYKIGSALAICLDRSPEPFISDLDFDGDGVDMEALFEVIEPGQVHLWSEARLAPIYDQQPRYQSRPESEDFVGGMPPESQMGVIGSAYSHGFRLSVGALCVERPARIIEVGFRSNLSVKSSGIAAFNSFIAREQKAGDKYPSGSYQAYVDAEFCGGLSGSDNDTQENTYRKEIQPAKYTASDVRYSFFRISVRNIDGDAFEPLSNLYGVRSATGVNVYNYLRFIFPDNVRREMRFTPITAWEIRSGTATGELVVMDPHVESKFTVTDNGVQVEGNGEIVERDHMNFRIKNFCNPNEFTGGITGLGEFEPGSGYRQPRNGDTWRHIELEKDDNDDTGEGYVFADLTIGEGGAVTAVTYPGTAPQGQTYEVGTWLKLRQEGFLEGNGFRVQVGSVSGEYVTQLGVAPHDDPDYNCYVDGWPRLAETFIYDAVQSSCEGSPEHSIAYVNVITDNDEPPTYEACAVLGLNIRSSRELTSLDQLSVYVTQGVINSHAFPDVLWDLFTNDRYGTGEIFDPKQIDKQSFDAAADWTTERKYFFDGAISSKINLRSWGADRARDFLLDLGVSGGKFVLKPVLTFDGEEAGREPIAAMFSAGNILEGSFQLSYLETQDRMPPIVSVKWRQERLGNGLGDRGLFPQIRELTVKCKDTPVSAPVIQIDLSGFATTQRHAIDRAKFECLQRKYVNHVISFKTLPSEATLQVGSIIKVGMETLRYEQPKNGAVMRNGTVVTWPPLSDGSYDVILWDGSAVSEQQIEIRNGRCDAIGAIFCLADKEAHAQAYKIQSVGFDQDGNVEIEAIYWPVDEADQSLLAKDFGDNGFDITGRI